MGFSKSFIAVVMAMMMAISMMGGTRAQIPDCATKLVPCADYLNSTTKPPDSCCQPIRETVEKQLDCLCKLYNNPSLLQSFGINITQALGLTKTCGIPADVSSCKNAQAPAGSTVPPPPGVAGNDGNDASKMALTGISSLVLFWASIMAY